LNMVQFGSMSLRVLKVKVDHLCGKVDILSIPIGRVFRANYW
jgi:hypothetical protein